jgi:GNAT superfamily N-acetyltransferase
VTTIEPLAPGDHDEWLPLWQGYLTFYRSSLSDELTELAFTRLTDDGYAGLQGALARDESGKAIGLVHWLTHPSTWAQGPYCYLEDLFVASAARGAGVGAALIEYVHAWAQETGCAKVYWLTQEDNARARALYERVADRSGFLHYEITR